MRTRVMILAGLSGATIAAAAGARPFVVRSAAGAAAADIQSTVDQFRVDISAGGGNNGVAGGPFVIGRREINWDAAGLDAFQSPALMPADFFNNNSKRGASFSTPGTGFLVSQRVPMDPANARFGDISAPYASAFQTFSPNRLFAAQGSTITDTTFFVPNEPGASANINGFGVVFTDVDLANSARIELYDFHNVLMASAAADTFNNGLSFIGVAFTGGERVFRVRIIAGNTVLGGTDDPQDLQDVVVMDDFIYSEPIVLPSPGASLLAAFAVGARCRRRR